jgi:hypothetical protein
LTDVVPHRSVASPRDISSSNRAMGEREKSLLCGSAITPE